jgi:hypothetical protein
MSELLLDLVKSTKVVGKSTKVDATVQWDAEGRTVNGVSFRTLPVEVVDAITAHGVVTALGTIAPFNDRRVTGRKPKGADAAPMVAAKVVDLGGGVSIGFRERTPGASDWVPVVVTETLTAADLGF